MRNVRSCVVPSQRLHFLPGRIVGCGTIIAGRLGLGLFHFHSPFSLLELSCLPSSGTLGPLSLVESPCPGLGSPSPPVPPAGVPRRSWPPVSCSTKYADCPEPPSGPKFCCPLRPCCPTWMRSRLWAKAISTPCASAGGAGCLGTYSLGTGPAADRLSEKSTAPGALTRSFSICI